MTPRKAGGLLGERLKGAVTPGAAQGLLVELEFLKFPVASGRRFLAFL